MGAVLIYKYGEMLRLIDVPHSRSSHSKITPRAGGIGIWLSFILITILLANNYKMAVLGGIAGLCGLSDDIFNISAKARLLIYLFISGVSVFLYGGNYNLLIAILWMLFITGTLNVYNFMDGINGMAGLTGVICFGLTAYFSYFIHKDSEVSNISICLITGCLSFLPFNFPKARVFMGDVGSIFLGLMFALFVLRLSNGIAEFLCVSMFLYTFHSDATLTILYRLRDGEDLTTPHRRHLYQYLCNELRVPHWKVSLSYAIIQLIFGIISIIAYSKGIIWQLVFFAISIMIFVSSYKMIKEIPQEINEEPIR
jgi:Fuc2NAc and GlcNAc transferase